MQASLEHLHKRSRRNRSRLAKSSICSCFYCFKEFRFEQIKKWIDDLGTAICPRRGTDTVLGFDVPPPTSTCSMKCTITGSRPKCADPRRVEQLG
jgi:hypothetical protein